MRHQLHRTAGKRVEDHGNYSPSIALVGPKEFVLIIFISAREHFVLLPSVFFLSREAAVSYLTLSQETLIIQT